MYKLVKDVLIKCEYNDAKKLITTNLKITNLFIYDKCRIDHLTQHKCLL